MRGGYRMAVAGSEATTMVGRMNYGSAGVEVCDHLRPNDRLQSK